MQSSDISHGKTTYVVFDNRTIELVGVKRLLRTRQLDRIFDRANVRRKTSKFLLELTFVLIQSKYSLANEHSKTNGYIRFKQAFVKEKRRPKSPVQSRRLYKQACWGTESEISLHIRMRYGPLSSMAAFHCSIIFAKSVAGRHWWAIENQIVPPTT